MYSGPAKRPGEGVAMKSITAGLVLGVLTAGTAGAEDLSPIERLGKSVFFDTNLSARGNQACAS